MLIRLMGHFQNNPGHIDKLICIKGLPEEWIFRKSRFGGDNSFELVHPWEPDIYENIPKEIRHMCEPREVTFVFPPIEKGKDYVVDKRTILGVRFNYMTEPGQVLWDKIERYLDRMTPRDQKVPVPVMVAADHKSPFNPHEARRSSRGSLELRPAEIPVVDLTKPLILENVDTAIDEKAEYERLKAKFGTSTIVMPTPTTTTTVASTTVKVSPVEPPVALPCDFQGCNKVFDKRQALAAHKRFGHKKEIQPVGV